MKKAIVVEHVYKKFRKYPTQSHTTLKEALLKGHIFRMRENRQYREVLKDITFCVPAGTVLGIIGPNGAGKSTLLRLIAGIYRPTSGKITVNGRLSALLNLGLGFHPELTGRENIIIGGLAMGLSKHEIKYRLDDIVAFAELEEFIDAPVRTYSSGMYMRLAFSVAVNVDPDILLLDEVLAVGDAQFAEKSRSKMEEFKRKGKTILLVTHNLATVKSWCHQALWLEAGKFRNLGEPNRVIDQYNEESLALAI